MWHVETRSTAIAEKPRNVQCNFENVIHQNQQIVSQLSLFECAQCVYKSHINFIQFWPRITLTVRISPWCLICHCYNRCWQVHFRYFEYGMISFVRELSRVCSKWPILNFFYNLWSYRDISESSAVHWRRKINFQASSHKSPKLIKMMSLMNLLQVYPALHQVKLSQFYRPSPKLIVNMIQYMRVPGMDI